MSVVAAHESAVELLLCRRCAFGLQVRVVFSDVAGSVCWEDPRVLPPFADWDEVVPLQRVVVACLVAADPAGRACPYPPQRTSPPISGSPPLFACPLMERLPPTFGRRGVFAAACSGRDPAAVEAWLLHVRVAGG